MDLVQRPADPLHRYLAFAGALHLLFFGLIAAEPVAERLARVHEAVIEFDRPTTPEHTEAAPRSEPTHPRASHSQRNEATASAPPSRPASVEPTAELQGAGGADEIDVSASAERGGDAPTPTPSRSGVEPSARSASDPGVSRLDVRTALQGHSGRIDSVDLQSERFRGHGGLSRAYAVNDAAARVPVVPGTTRFGRDKKGALRGTLCFIPPDTRSLKELARCTPSAVLYADSLDIPWRRFTDGFPGISSRYEWFALDYRGSFEVRVAGDYLFRLFSQDGSILWIDGDKVIDNDGIHVAECPQPPSGGGRAPPPPRLPCAISKARMVTLSAGYHTIRVFYFRGPSRAVVKGQPLSPALQLFVRPPGQPEGLWKPAL